MPRKAFSRSADTAYRLILKESNSLPRSGTNEGPDQRQSLREGELDEQSYTILNAVVEEFFFTPW